MIGIERERNWIVGVSEFYDSPISSLCQKVSTSSRVLSIGPPGMHRRRQ